jgi:hypothetical protein
MKEKGHTKCNKRGENIELKKKEEKTIGKEKRKT